MAKTKVPGGYISDEAITAAHLHSSHGITTNDIGEHTNNKYYTDARVDARLAASKSTAFITTGNIEIDSDTGKLRLGAGADLRIYHSGFDSYIDNHTGHLVLRNLADDKDIVLQTDNGSGGTADYLRLVGGYTRILASQHFRIADTKQIQLGDDADFSANFNGNHTFITNNTGILYLTQNVDDGVVHFRNDDGSGGVTQYITLHGSTGEVRLGHYGNVKLATKSDGIDVTGHIDATTLTTTGNVAVGGNLTVTGTTTTVNTVTMNAQNAVIFEGTTADDYETTLTIIDPTVDRTINLPNQSGTIPVLAAASNTAITATPAELNYVDGVTSNIQTQLNAKQATISSSTDLTLSSIVGTSTNENRLGALFVGADSDVYLYESATNAFTIRTGASGAYKYFTFAADGKLNLANDGLQIGGTIVIDSSRNLTNIGTISNNNTISTSIGSTLFGLNITGSSSSYTSASIRNTGSGDAILWFDASNGDLAGSDYASIRQNNALDIVLRTEANGQGISFQTKGTQKFRISGGGTLELGSSNTAILDQSRNLTNINSISSGAITSSGTITSSGQFTSASGDASFRRAGSSTARIRIESGNTFSDQNFAVNGSIKIGSTAIVDSSRNLTNIGTISSGAITVNTSDLTIEGGQNASTRGLIIKHTGQTGNQTKLENVSNGVYGRLHTTERRLIIHAASDGSAGSSETLDLWTNGTRRVKIAHNGPITFNEAYTFPTSDGSANQVLQTDGSGNLSFATVSSGGSGFSTITEPAAGQLKIGAQSGANEGGEILLEKASANGGGSYNTDIFLDNYQNKFRIHSGGSVDLTVDTVGNMTVPGDINLPYGSINDSGTDLVIHGTNAVVLKTDGGTAITIPNNSTDINLGSGKLNFSRTSEAILLDSAHSKTKIGLYGGIGTGAEYIGTSANTVEISGTNVNLNGASGSGTANLKMGGTTVIDSSRNMSNIGTISSGAITATSLESTSGDISLSGEKFVNEKQYSGTSNIGTSGAYYTLGFITEHNTPTYITLKSAAHSTQTFVVTTGYWGSNVAHVQMLSSTYTQNGGYPGVSAVRILKDSSNNYRFQLKLTYSSGPVGFTLDARAVGATPNSDVFSFQSSLTVDTTTGTTIEEIETGFTGSANSGQNRSDYGSSSAPSYSFKEDSDTGIYRQGANSLGLVAGGIERLRIQSDVSVLGTTDLHIAGSNRRLSFTSGTGTIRTTNATSLILQTGSTTALTLDSSQNATFAGNIIGNDIKAAGSGGLSLQTDEGTKRIEITDGGTVDIKNASLRIGTTTVIDSSRNLSNIGTISSGAITSSGSVTAGTSLELPSSGMIDWQNGDARIIEGLTNNYSLSFQTYDGSSLTTALRLDGNNTATFSSDVRAQKYYLPNTAYGLGIVNAASARLDTVDSGVNSDPLELVYYSGAGVIVGAPSDTDHYFISRNIGSTADKIGNIKIARQHGGSTPVTSIDNLESFILSKTDGGYGSGTKPPGSHNGTGIISLQTHTGNYFTQLALSTNTNDLFIRSADNTSSFGSYEKLLKESTAISTGTITVTGNIAVSGTVDGRDVATDGSKLDGIAAGANNITNNNQLTNGAGYITSSGTAANATQAGGLNVHNTQGTQATANTILRTNQHGYTMLGWINTTSGSTTSAMDRIYASNDAYIRYYTPANFLNSGGMGEKIFNNQARNHATFTNFNTDMPAGVHYLQQGNNGPTGTASHQFYGMKFGLGNEYGTTGSGGSDYSAQMYFPRAAQGGGNGLYFRDKEGGSFGSWRQVDAGTVTGFAPKSATGATGANQVLRSHSNGYFIHDNWMRVDGGGLYSGTNGAHFYPNTTTSYATWATTGSRGGYDGILFDGGGDMAVMFDGSANGGFYRQASSRWVMYHHIGNNSTGFGSSTTSSSYQMYVNGAIYASGDIVGSSDERLKTEIKTIPNALDKVLQLRGVTYKWIDSEEGGSCVNNITETRMGVIAQEVVDILPEVVTHDKENDRYGVSYGHLTGVLIEAVKELKQEVNELKKELEEVKNG